ncbi:hypothetical protein AMK16_06695 [Streptomyces sp. CB00455]|nr:hypothetical protein AMK16_06695 [Streptomyces sp. CB00455]
MAGHHSRSAELFYLLDGAQLLAGDQIVTAERGDPVIDGLFHLSGSRLFSSGQEEQAERRRSGQPG